MMIHERRNQKILFVLMNDFILYFDLKSFL